MNNYPAWERQRHGVPYKNGISRRLQRIGDGVYVGEGE